MILLILLQFAVVAKASPKEVADFYKESKAESELASKEKDFKGKASHLKKLGDSINQTLKEYKKLTPKEGDKKEEAVSMFFFTLEPVFKMMKEQPSIETCAQARHEIEKNDRAGRGEDATVTEPAAEALDWLTILCY